MTPGGIDDGIALRFHLMRSARESAYDVPRRRTVPGEMRRSAWLVATVAVCAVLAALAVAEGGRTSAALLVLPVALAWWMDRRSRTMDDDMERPGIWQMAAYGVVRHVLRDPYGTNGEDVLDQVMHSRPAGRSMTYEQVARLVYLSRITTLRNRMLVLSHLQLLLLAQAERLRVDARYGSDRLDDAQTRAVRQSLRHVPGRGRRPVSIATEGLAQGIS